MATTVASLQARADGGQFTLTQASNTPLRGGGSAPFQPPHPLQSIVPHGSSSRTAISWTAVYRTRVMPGVCLVVDSAVALAWLQAVLDDANTRMDAIDLNMNLYGVAPNGTLGPTGQPNPSAGLQGY